MRSLQPKPDVAILGIAGRPNLNGLPYQGSAAEFATREVEWLHHPERVIWVSNSRKRLPKCLLILASVFARPGTYQALLRGHDSSDKNGGGADAVESRRP